MRAAFSKAEIESEIASRFSVAFRLPEKAPTELMSTGVPAIDSLAGGLPRGAITEIFGPASSGRTSLMLSILASATTHQEVCALIDTNDVFDPTIAAEAGVEPEQLLWVRCAANIEHAFKAADLLLQGGGFGLVIIDIGDVPSRDAQRIISSWWYRFRRTVESTPTVFMVIAQKPCVRSCASLTLEMNHGVDMWVATGNTSFKKSGKEVFSSPNSVFNYLSSVTPPTPNPTHSNLLVNMQLLVERQKPFSSGEIKAHFRAQASYSL